MKSRLKWLVLVLCLVMGFSALAIACGGDEGGDAGVKSLKLNVTEINVDLGDTYQLVATVDPADAEVSYTSSNPIVADVSRKTGKVTTYVAGDVTITATAGNKTATCLIHVVALEDPYWIAGVVGIENEIVKSELWGAGNADDYKDDLTVLGARRLTAVEGEEGVYSATLNLYEGDNFKIRTLGKDWSGQLNYDANIDADEWDDEYISNNPSDITGEQGFLVKVDGNYTITVTEGTPTLVSYTFNNEVDPLPKAAEYYVSLWGALGTDTDTWGEEPRWGYGVIKATDTSLVTNFIAEFGEGDVLQVRVGPNETTGFTDYGDSATWTYTEGDFNKFGSNQGSFIEAGIYYVTVELNEGGQTIKSIDLHKGIPLEINAWGDWITSWSDGEITHVTGTDITAYDTAVTMEMTIEFTEVREFGFQVRIEGQSSSEWAAGGQVTDTNAALTSTGNFKLTEDQLGTYKFTFSIKYDSTSKKLVVAITGIEKVNEGGEEGGETGGDVTTPDDGNDEEIEDDAE